MISPKVAVISAVLAAKLVASPVVEMVALLVSEECHVTEEDRLIVDESL